MGRFCNRPQSVVAIAGHENEGGSAVGGMSATEKLPAVEIDVEHGGDRNRQLDQAQGVVEAAGHTGQAVAEVGEHILQQHPDKEFVFDNKDLVAGGFAPSAGGGCMSSPV